jgi:hypothetical protein
MFEAVLSSETILIFMNNNIKTPQKRKQKKQKVLYSIHTLVVRHSSVFSFEVITLLHAVK